MEKLWSPWRSKYIDSFHDKVKTNGCIFCGMLTLDRDDDDNLVVENGTETFTVLNLYPYNNGHLMIVPKRHTSDFGSLNEKEKAEIFSYLQLFEKVLKEAFHPDGFNVGVNIGKASGAGIDDHIHFHIVPRWNGDTNFMPVLGEVKVISQELGNTKKNIIRVLEQLNDH